MYFQEAGAASGTGLVQQTVQIVASHDLTLFVVLIAMLFSVPPRGISCLPADNALSKSRMDIGSWLETKCRVRIAHADSFCASLNRKSACAVRTLVCPAWASTSHLKGEDRKA